MPTDFWESLRRGFAQLRAECAINPPVAPAGRLTAIWTAVPEPGHWRLNYHNGKDGSGVAKRFTWHAQSGAAQLGFVGDDDAALAFWLDRIRREAPEQYLNKINIAAGPDGADQLYSVEILDICGLSAEYCRKCEADQVRSQAAPRPPKSDRILTKEQKDRIAATEKELDDSIVAHENMRALMESNMWQRASTVPNAPTMSGDTQTLKRAIVKYGVDALTVLAEASWSLSSVESIRSHLETDAHSIVARVRAKVNPQDLPLLDTGALEIALNVVVSEWVRRAQRDLPPPWETDAPAAGRSKQHAGVAATTDSAFWMARHLDFLTYANRFADLRAIWKAYFGSWRLWWGSTPEAIQIPPEVLNALNAAASKALAGLSSSNDSDSQEPWWLWLEFMRKRKWGGFSVTGTVPVSKRVWEAGVRIGRPPVDVRRELGLSTSDEPEADHKLEDLTLDNLFRESADFCEDLARVLKLVTAAGATNRGAGETSTLESSIKVIDSPITESSARKGGRPAFLVDGERIRELRGEYSQAVFARLCKVSVDAVQRAECYGRSSDKTIRRIVRKLKGQGQKIEVKDLIRNPPQ